MVNSVGAGEVLDGAPVLEGDQGAAFAADDDDGHVADLGGAAVARVLDLDLEAQEMPGRAFEDFSLFGAEDVGVLVEPVGDIG